MISTIPVWIIFISSIMGIEKTNLYQIIGVILSLIGVIAIITKKIDFELIKNLSFNKGDISMTVAMFSWAIFSILLKKKTQNIPNCITTNCYYLWFNFFNPSLYRRNIFR